MIKGLVSLHVARLCQIGGAAVIAWWVVIFPVLADLPASTGQKDSLRFAQADSPTSAPAPASPQREAYAISDLEVMLAPIALYPDPLLLLILEASGFPLQIVQADRWLVDNPDAAKRGDFSGVDAQPWESSVKALTRFPDVVEMLADYLDWTESLGAAFALQPSDVSTAVQLLRAQAEKAGNLQSTPQQTVRVAEESGSRVIYIAPANPERIYVPVYDSTRVFQSAFPGALAFGTGVLVGSTWNNRWGWNNRYWNRVWVTRPGWQRPPNWRPRPPAVRPPGIGRPGGVRPGRPGVRPDRPGARPGRPGTRPDRPSARPDRPSRPDARPDRPRPRPDRPAARPDRPSRPDARPDRPRPRPDRPAARPDRPSRPDARPDRPRPRPDRPAARPNRPNQPGARPNRPTARPGGAANRSNRPAARPGSTQSRPSAGGQRARPQGGPAQRRRGQTTRQ
jgi:hypothetical protein